MTPQTARDLRIQLGLSQYRVAKTLGISRTHYHLFERGERALGAARLAMLTDLLKPSFTNSNNIPDDLL